MRGSAQTFVINAPMSVVSDTAKVFVLARVEEGTRTAYTEAVIKRPFSEMLLVVNKKTTRRRAVRSGHKRATEDTWSRTLQHTSSYYGRALVDTSEQTPPLLL